MLTPEQLAKDITAAAVPEYLVNSPWSYALTAAIATALRDYGAERAKAERERAARVCDRLFADDPEAALALDGYNAALACGARIRALD